METVEVKLEVNVAKSVVTCLAFLRPFDIRYSDKQRKTQREISDRLDELSCCYARHIVYIHVATTMDGKDRNFSVFFNI